MDRLFVYGSLQPGGPNEHVLASFDGDWQPGSVRGRLVEEGWGAAIGYPGLRLDDHGENISGQVLFSVELADNWEELDRFEGEAYRRVSACVSLHNGGCVNACVYALKNG